MSGFTITKSRNVIPRWRTFDDTAALGELGPSSRKPSTPSSTPSQPDSLAQTRADWDKHQTIGHAADLVGAALFLDRSDEVQDAIDFLLRNESQTTKWVRELLDQSSLESNMRTASTPLDFIREDAEERVRKLRITLRDEPKDPITQVDLAHAYATLGLNDQASEHLVIAQQLAPDNRFVLRSASCFWLKTEDFDRAYDSLIQSDATRHDPWLMSAEIAIGNDVGKSPRYINRARRLITDQKFSAFHCSELTSAVATIDWNNGAVVKATRLFERSLEKPTENSLAQAVWVSAQDGSVSLDSDLWRIPRVYEAKARDSYWKKEWELAARHCELWQRDQPFSRGPGIDGSFISIVALNDFQRAKRFAETGRVANPDDYLLQNNLVVALINLNEFDEAQKLLSQISLSKVSEDRREVANVTKLATRGLLQYRLGNVQKGRQLYLDARTLARRLPSHLSYLEARATAFHAIEEVPYIKPNHYQLIDYAMQLLRNQADPASDILQSKLDALRYTL